jgi:hypothetical protein
MIPSVAPFPDDRQGQSLKAFQSALGRGVGRRLALGSRTARKQPGRVHGLCTRLLVAWSTASGRGRGAAGGTSQTVLLGAAHTCTSGPRTG